MKKVGNYKLQKLQKILKPYIKMDKKVIEFDDTETEEYKFHQYKSPILINKIGINKIVVSYKFPFSKHDFKYFIGYKDKNEIRPSCIFFPEVSIYKRHFDKTKFMYFIVKDEFF